MSAPGVILKEVDPAIAQRDPLATDALLLVASSKRGRITPFAVTRGKEKSLLGDYIATSQAREAVEWFLANGGEYVVFSRLVGPAPTFGTRTIKAANGTDDALTFTMVEPGDWTTGWTSKVVVVAGSTVKVQFIDPDGNVYVETPGFASAAEAVAWSAQSQFVKFADPPGAFWPPVQAAATAFATQGSDDIANVTNTQRQAALDRLVKEYGAGQVAVLGDTTAATHAMLADHANTHNRVALEDLVDTATLATLTAASLADRAATKDKGARRTGAFGGSWIVAPGATPVDANRILPLSVAAAAKCAENDLAGVPISQPPAGAFGAIDGATGLSQLQPTFTEAQRETLNEASVNIARQIGSDVKLYGFRSLTDPLADPGWAMLSSARTVMLAEAIVEQVGENVSFANIDAQGTAAGVLKSQIVAALTTHPRMKRALYAPPEVVVTTTARRFTASLTLTVTDSGETVQINVTNAPIGG